MSARKLWSKDILLTFNEFINPVKRRYCKCQFIRGIIHLPSSKKSSKIYLVPNACACIMGQPPLWPCPTSTSALLADRCIVLSPPAPHPCAPCTHVYFWAWNHLEGKGAHQVEKFIPTTGKALLATQWPSLKDTCPHSLEYSDSFIYFYFIV